MKKVDVIKEIKLQLGRVPTAEEVLALCDKPSILNAVKNSKKFNNVQTAFNEYIQRNNQSWYAVLEDILKKQPSQIAINYRGTKITNEELIERVEATATKLYESGVRPGDVIAVCMSNTPEYIYIKCALNLIGAVCNSFSSNYTPDKIDQIVNSCSNKLIISTDREYKQIANHCDKFEKVVLNSLADSLSEDSKPPVEYPAKLREKLNKYYQYTSEVEEIKKQDPRVVSFDEVVTHPINRELIDELKARPRDSKEICSITYTSGSTSQNPKGLLHTDSAIVTSAIRHLPEVTGSQPMKGMVSLFNIHTDSNTANITQMLDILFQGGTVAPEPEYDLDSFLDVLYINKPNIAASTTSLYIEAAKQAKRYFQEGIYQAMPWLVAPTAVGEGLSPNEQRFLDSFLHFEKAGKGFKLGNLIIPIPIVMSTGGGDCERGGIFFTVFKKLQDLKCKLLYHESCGLVPYPDSKLAVLNPETLEEVRYGERGIVVSSPTESTFVGYKDADNSNDYITDKYGRVWCNLNLEGRNLRNGSVEILGRYRKDVLIGESNISINELNQEVLTIDRIFSSCTMVIEDEEKEYLVIDYIPCKNDLDRKTRNKNSIEEIEQEIEAKIKELIIKKYPGVDLSKIFIRRTEGRYPVTGSCKRDLRKIEAKGLEEAKPLCERQKVLKRV